MLFQSEREKMKNMERDMFEELLNVDPNTIFMKENQKTKL